MNGVATWPGQAESWLDQRGRGAWIAAMVVGFIVFWPVGLALLAYMLWSKRMSSGEHFRKSLNLSGGDLYRSTGNATFDAYKAETLRRLEDEQAAFDAFLKRLREAKDKSEFDAFMDDRAKRRSDDVRTDA
jgi:hypothetical protein